MTGATLSSSSSSTADPFLTGKLAWTASATKLHFLQKLEAVSFPSFYPALYYIGLTVKISRSNSFPGAILLYHAL